MKKFGRFVCLMLVFTVMMSYFAMPAMAKTVKELCPGCNKVQSVSVFCSGVGKDNSKTYEHPYTIAGGDVVCQYYYYRYYDSHKCNACAFVRRLGTHSHYEFHSKHNKPYIKCCPYR